MDHIIIDRRKNDKGKSTVNRSRYMRRVKEAIKDSVRDIIRDGSIADSLNKSDKKIKINRKDLEQPWFHHKKTGGVRDKVYSGNEHFVVGDKFRRHGDEESDGGNKAGKGQSQDEFEFTISQQEFLDIFFENLYLPDMVKKDMAQVNEYVNKRAGFTTDGNPSRLNIIRSMKQSISRTIALCSEDEEELEKLENEKICLEFDLITANMKKGQMTIHIENKIKELDVKIEELKKKLRAIPFIDDIDLRYNRWEKQPVPSTQAVIFGLMDVSGSMGEWEKDMAKRFFLLMLLFLHRRYEKVVFVPISHTTEANEVTEEEFFTSRESGGTLVSSAYELMEKIQKERFPTSSWNVYGLQISDGDDDNSDIPVCVDHLQNKILPMSQYFAYVETKKDSIRSLAAMLGGNSNSNLYNAFKRELFNEDNFEVAVIGDAAHIYPVFRKLFEKKK